MENKIFWKSISIDRVFYGFDSKIGLHFYFHFKPFPGLRRVEREREERVTDRTPAPRRHISRTTTEITSPPKTDPPKITSPQTDRTPPKTDPPRLITPRPIHRRLHHPRPIAPHLDCITTKDRSTQNRSHQRHRYPWLISLPYCRYPWPISPFPSIFDHSLFLPLSV